MVKLYIGNLPYDMTEQELLRIVSAVGPALWVDIVVDKMSGRSRGFGFIDVPHTAAAELIIHGLNLRQMAGRKVVVNEARPMTPRPRGDLSDTSTTVSPDRFGLHVAIAEPVADFELTQNLIQITERVERDLFSYFVSHPQEMKRMPHRKFEELVAEMWKRMDYEVELTKQTCDGGVDIIAIRRAEANVRYLIQCKRPEPDKKISVEAVRTLLGVKEDLGGSKAFLATTVTFTPDAQEVLDRHQWEVEGRDYYGLLDWISRAAGSRDER